MRLKFCGITNKEDALNAVNLGVDALGFIFYSESSRSVSVEQVQEIIYYLPPFVTTVGVFVNHDIDEVNSTLDECKLDIWNNGVFEILLSIRSNTTCIFQGPMGHEIGHFQRQNFYSGDQTAS